MRTQIVAGNWKMNKSFSEAEELIGTIASELEDRQLKCEVVLCPPALYLEMASDYADESDFFVGAQNVSEHDEGAFTGEISAAMLNSVDVDFCIVGHSERRKYFHEDNYLLANKVNKLLDHEIIPIYCCGELLAEREKNIHFDIVEQQIKEGLFHLSEDEFSNIVVAYEPVWAIGTGVTATPEQAQEMHAFIRNVINGKYGEEAAENTTILYGGSCNAANAKELFSQADVDGGLIGGASLKAEDFLTIANSF
ncbi:MAG: triose-phosphate isomerase [Bacteroidetes bacterium]|nr:MAG: triose-phosphate isomerase [Bacteroidota bacterium]RLD47222.1 MAG: triose-phosphate isomerase [Bacteroidota bacterium]RLD84036.1 MAG: triose-phosphate isomerase [Bacteroidota bacterium]